MEAVEIGLDTAYQQILAAEQAALAAAGGGPGGRRASAELHRCKAAHAEPEASIGDIRAALVLAPNPDLDWSDWVRVGLATWRSSGGSEEGREVFHDWSRKSAKYDAGDTDTTWDRFARSPPDRIGFATLFYMARQADPNWRKPSDIALDPPPVDAEGRPIIDVDVAAETEPGPARFRSTRLPIHRRKLKGQRPGPGAEGVAGGRR